MISVESRQLSSEYTDRIPTSSSFSRQSQRDPVNPDTQSGYELEALNQQSLDSSGDYRPTEKLDQNLGSDRLILKYQKSNGQKKF